MADELVKIATGGFLYEGWETVQIISEIDVPYLDFIVETTEIGEPGEWGKPGRSKFRDWNFPPGSPIEIYANDTFVLSGAVYVYQADVSPDMHKVQVSGSTTGLDFIESSVDHPTGNFENTTDAVIIQTLATPYGQQIINDTPPESVPYWQIRQGSSNFFEITRLLQDYQKFLGSDPHGNIVVRGGKFIEQDISSFTPYGVGGAIMQGENVLSMSCRMQDYGFAIKKVLAQSVIGVDHLSLEVFGEAFDGSRRPTRRQTIIAQRDMTQPMAQRRAEWEIMRQSGDELEATFLVRGWRNTDGHFWRVNTDVYVWAPILQIDCVLRIKRVILSQSVAQGTVSQITVTNPQAYGGPQIACSSGDMWMIPVGGLNKIFGGNH